MTVVVNFVNGTWPVVVTNQGVIESLTEGGTSVATTAVALYADSYAIVHTGDNAVAVTTGASPTATATTGVYIPANSYREIRVAQGEKVAVITV